MSPEVTLTGDALVGVDTSHLAQNLIERLPQRVKLGRRPPHPGVKNRMVHLSDFFDESQLSAPPPAASPNRRTKAAAALARMYLNDQLGDCVWASNMHYLGVTSANDDDSEGVIQATDLEVQQQYVEVCGPGDNGCVITDTLDYGIRTGWQAGGKRYKLDGYAAVDWTNKVLTQVVQLIIGASKIGIMLPSAWTSSAVWDVTSTRIVGGHDVLPIDYDENGVYVASWARVYLITWKAWLSTRWLEEYFAVLAATLYGRNKLAANGFSDVALTAAMAQFAKGGVPDWQAPVPVTPPNPPGPGPNPNPNPAGSFRLMVEVDPTRRTIRSIV
jgi:hypothetical protein